MTRSALVVRGGWEGHSPVEATNRFLPFLQANGFAVQVEDTPEVYADADAMAGTGFGGWHGGIADSFRNTSDYLHLVGGQFVDHPARIPGHRTGDPSDNYVSYTVNIRPDTADHPIVAGLKDFELYTEQYWVLTDDYIDVLATTTLAARPEDPWHRPIVSPAIWTRTWGEGRIFVATPGHSLDIVDHPTVRTVIERGLLWAARQPSEGSS
jgi:type 1 glutamine amidotransferase